MPLTQIKATHALLRMTKLGPGRGANSRAGAAAIDPSSLAGTKAGFLQHPRACRLQPAGRQPRVSAFSKGGVTEERENCQLKSIHPEL